MKQSNGSGQGTRQCILRAMSKGRSLRVACGTRPGIGGCRHSKGTPKIDICSTRSFVRPNLQCGVMLVQWSHHNLAKHCWCAGKQTFISHIIWFDATRAIEDLGGEPSKHWRQHGCRWPPPLLQDILHTIWPSLRFLSIGPCVALRTRRWSQSKQLVHNPEIHIFDALGSELWVDESASGCLSRCLCVGLSSHMLCCQMCSSLIADMLDWLVHCYIRPTLVCLSGPCTSRQWLQMACFWRETCTDVLLSS